VYAFTASPIHPAASTKVTPIGFITEKEKKLNEVLVGYTVA
jgi:hypothetical protein